MSDSKITIRTAILVDGGFYKKRARYYWGEKTPEKRAEELRKYCMSLLYSKYENRSLYRIFYYDCPPLSKKIYHPMLKRTIDLKRTPEYAWQNTFLEELHSKRKFAIRLGELSENTAQYILKPESVKKLINGTITVDMLRENDFSFQAEQKGVDMRIGVDIVDQLLDFGVLVEPVDVSRYNSLRLPAKDTWGLILRRDHPLAQKNHIQRKDLIGIPLIMSRQDMTSQKAGNDYLDWFGKTYESLNIVAGYNLMYNGALMVKSGIGCAVGLDQIINTTETSDLCFRPFDPPLEAGIVLIWKKYQVFSRPAEMLLERMIKAFEYT